MTQSTLLVSLLAALILPACMATSIQDGATTAAAATPQRPTFSSNTATTAEGTVELEAGIDYDHHDVASLPVAIKYGLTPTTELFVAGVPRAQAHVSGGRDLRGHGDTTVGARQRFWWDQEFDLSAAWQLAAQLPTGSHTKGFSDDEYSFFAAAILDGHVDEWAWTAFYQLGALGDPTGSGFDTQRGAAFAVSRPLDEAMSVYAELASVDTHARGDNPLFAFTGLTFAENPRVVWDVGGRFGLNHDGGDPALLAGVTVNFGRVGGTTTAKGMSAAAGN